MPKRDHGAPAVSWWNSIPTTGPTGTATTWVGNQLFFDVPGRVAGFRFYVANGQDGNSRCTMWNRDTVVVHVACVARPRITTGDQWQQVWFRPWLRIDETSLWRFAVCYPGGKFFRNNSILTGFGISRNGMTFHRGFTTTSLTPEIATITELSNAHAVDLLFYPD